MQFPLYKLSYKIFQFLPAGSTLEVLKKLLLQASGIAARYHQAFCALFAGFLHESPFSAMRTENVKRPAAARAHSVAFLYLPETGRAGIAKGAVAAAFRAET
jgi:hypothetical protein